MDGEFLFFRCRNSPCSSWFVPQTDYSIIGLSTSQQMRVAPSLGTPYSAYHGITSHFYCRDREHPLHDGGSPAFCTRSSIMSPTIGAYHVGSRVRRNMREGVGRMRGRCSACEKKVYFSCCWRRYVAGVMYDENNVAFMSFSELTS